MLEDEDHFFFVGKEFAQQDDFVAALRQEEKRTAVKFTTQASKPPCLKLLPAKTLTLVHCTNLTSATLEQEFFLINIMYLMPLAVHPA